MTVPAADLEAGNVVYWLAVETYHAGSREWELKNFTASYAYNTSTCVPTAVDDSAVTEVGAPVTIPIVGNDTLPTGSIGPVLGTPPANGTVVVNPDGTVTYTPNPGFTGTDTFTYVITGPNGDQRTATVTVNVVESAEVPMFGPPVAAAALMALVGAGAFALRRRRGGETA